jgi:hypothetical protein
MLVAAFVRVSRGDLSATGAILKRDIETGTFRFVLLSVVHTVKLVASWPVSVCAVSSSLSQVTQWLGTAAALLASCLRTLPGSL